jgi:lipoyl-dependent peroxiredoxin
MSATQVNSTEVTRINPTYTARASVTGGRNGHGVTDDGALEVDLKTPGSKGSESATNPEQLFAMGYAACYQQALFTEGRLRELDVSNAVVDSEVSLGKERGGEFYGLAVKLTVRIPGMDRALVQELAEAAHIRCPYSRATRGNIDVKVIAAG